MRAVRLPEAIDKQAADDGKVKPVEHRAVITIMSACVEEVKLEDTEAGEGPDGRSIRWNGHVDPKDDFHLL